MTMDEQRRAQAATFTYTAVISVFNSGAIVGDTLDQTAGFFEAQGWDDENIAINDGGSDNSESVLRAKENHSLG